MNLATIAQRLHLRFVASQPTKVDPRLRRRISRQMLIDHYLDLTIDIARNSSQTLQATQRRLAARWHEIE